MGERGKLTRILRDASPRESPVGRAPHCRARGSRAENQPFSSSDRFSSKVGWRLTQPPYKF